MLPDVNASSTHDAYGREGCCRHTDDAGIDAVAVGSRAINSLDVSHVILLAYVLSTRPADHDAVSNLKSLQR